MSENTERTPAMGGRPGMGRRGMGQPVEKAKDFKGSWGKLIRYCKSYMPVIIVALVIASLGTALQIIGPDVCRFADYDVL